MLGTRTDRGRKQQKVDTGRDGDNKRKIKIENKAVARNPAFENRNMPSKLDRAFQSMHPFTVPDLAFQWSPMEWHKRQKMFEEWSRSAL